MRSNPDIVATLFNLDPETILGPTEGLRRNDGTPATPDEVEARRNARLVDIRAVVELHRLALEQSKYKLDRQERIGALLDKYRRDTDTESTPLDAVVPRMTPQDRAEWNRLWADLGNIMVLTGDAQ
jgi:hypothetical protein